MGLDHWVAALPGRNQFVPRPGKQPRRQSCNRCVARTLPSPVSRPDDGDGEGARECSVKLIPRFLFGEFPAFFRVVEGST